MLVAREGEAGVDDDDVVAVLVDHHVLPDLAEAAERDDPERVRHRRSVAPATGRTGRAGYRGRVHLGLAPSYAALCLLQGAVALAPGRRRHLRSSAVVGLLLPAGALALGVALVRAGTGGADFLTALATTAAPLLSAALGTLRGWRHGWWTAPAAVALYLVAWLAPHGDLVTQAAGDLLIAGACLALATGIAALAPDRFIAVGLVGLVILDIVLVWATPEVATTTTTLHATAPPVPVPRARAARAPAPAPPGRDLRLGADGLARPARARAPRRDRAPPRARRARDDRGRPRWGLLLTFTDPIPATVPVLAGLALDYALRRSRGRSAARGSDEPAPPRPASPRRAAAAGRRPRGRAG